MGHWCSATTGLTNTDDSCPRGLVSWLQPDRTVQTTHRPVLGASTVGQSMPGSVVSSVSELLLQPFLLHSAQVRDAGLPIMPPMVPVCIDSGHGLHLFFGNRFDAGPVRLTSIVHAFNYYCRCVPG